MIATHQHEHAIARDCRRPTRPPSARGIALLDLPVRAVARDRVDRRHARIGLDLPIGAAKHDRIRTSPVSGQRGRAARALPNWKATLAGAAP